MNRVVVITGSNNYRIAIRLTSWVESHLTNEQDSRLKIILHLVKSIN